jgi:hypothetical protein
MGNSKKIPKQVLALAHAIEEGESTDMVNRDEVFKLLEGQA